MKPKRGENETALGGRFRAGRGLLNRYKAAVSRIEIRRGLAWRARLGVASRKRACVAVATIISERTLITAEAAVGDSAACGSVPSRIACVAVNGRVRWVAINQAPCVPWGCAVVAVVQVAGGCLGYRSGRQKKRHSSKDDGFDEPSHTALMISFPFKNASGYAGRLGVRSSLFGVLFSVPVKILDAFLFWGLNRSRY